MSRWHQASYKRLAVLAHGERLATLLETEGLLHAELSAARHPTFLAADVEIAHANVEPLRHLVRSTLRAVPPATFAPDGWHPRQGRDLGRERDIDVLALGTLDAPRRRGVLRRLERAGIAVEHAGSFRGRGTRGEERAELLSRTRIVLDVPRRPGEGSRLRCVLGMCHSAAVVSEPIAAPAPFVPGRHYLSAPVDRLAATPRGLLADEPRRRALAAAGERFVLDEMRLERSLDDVVEALSSVQAARREPRPE